MSKKLISLVLAMMLMCVSAMALAADEYQITFHPNSGSGEMAGATVPAGGSYTLPECGFTPPEGTVFSHWMTEGHPKLMPENTITVNSDLTILPAWVEEQYTIVLDPNLGDGKTYSETYQHDEEFYLPNGEEADLPFTVPEGKIIWNWVLLETGDDFEPGMSFVGRDGMVFRADWADAEWQENSYSVRLVVGEWAEERTSPVGTEFMLPNLRQLPCRNDFGEDAWIDYWTVDGVKYAPGSRLVLAQDTVATATLGEESTVVYMVMFSANGGSGSRIPMEVSAGTAIILPENPYTAPEGKQFKAWQIGTQQYAAGDSVTVTGEMTVSAVWETKVCKVTFDLNGVEGSYPVQEVEYGKQYTLPEPDAIVEVPENLNFKGWKIGGNTYSPNSPITVTEDITVVAQWSERLVSITYLNDDGEEIKVIGDLAYGTEHEELTPEAVGLTVPDGYVFDYWQVLNTRLEVIDTAYVGDDKPLVLYSNWLMKAVWKAAEVAETYTVTYDPGRGTGEIKTETATAGEKFPLINPSQLGYTAPEGEAFKAWSINGVEYPMHEFIDVTEDITATALWEAGECTVSFDANGGTGTMAPVTMAKGAEFTVPACGFTAPTGKQFKVWTIDDNEVKPDLVITPISDLTLKAVWEDAPVALCKITFDLNGVEGSYPVQEVEYGKQYTLPEPDAIVEVPENLNFKGWKIGGNTYSPNSPITVTEDITVVAQWSERLVSITYLNDDGEEIKVIGDLAYGTEHEELTPEAVGLTVPDGYVFDYWQVLNTRLEVIDTAYVGDNEPLVLYSNWLMKAVWKEAAVAQYTIAFDANGGTGEMASVTVNAGDSYTFPECGFTAPEGKVFDSWYYSYEGLDDYEPGFTVVDIHSSFTLKAIWKDAPVETQKVTITFEANGGEGEMASVTVDMGATIVLPACSFTKTGHTFAGWTYEETLQPGASLTVNTDMSILAVWDRNPCVLTFKPGEGTGEVKTYDMLYGDGVELRDPSVHGFSYEGHECVGWTDGTNTYTLGTLLDVEKDVTYTALWKKLSYTITFEGEQGSMASVTKEYGDTYVLPECGFQAPINNEFKAWDVNGTEYQIGASITVTGNVTVKPVWQWIEYTVTFDAQGGTGTMEPVTVLAGTDFTVPVCTFEAPEFKLFSAWVVDDEIVGGRYKAGDVITVYNDITLNAGWMNSEYKITYKSSAADDAEIYEDPIVGGSAYTLMNNMFTAPEGKMFRCWLFPVPPTFTETEELDPGTPFSRVGSNLTFIADWEPLKYIVSFDGNGGSGSMEAAVVEHGGEFTIPESGFTAPTGMVFSGWKLDGEAKKPGDSLIVTGGVTLTAQWAPMELAVSFDPGDRGGDSKTQTQLYGVKFNLPYLSDLGWDDYLSGSVFLGWNLNGEYLAEGAAFTATADTTLTAMWADRYYTITIKDSNESAAPTSVTVEYGDSYTLKSASAYGFRPKDSRIHVFDNWMRTSDQKTFAPGDTISGITRSMAFEAKWTFGTIVEVEDEETGEVVETVVEIEVTTQPEEIDQNDASVMNTSDPSKLPEQLGNMLAALQVNTAGAEAEGGVVIETMQDVVDALHESINGTVTTETEELEYPAENIAVTDIIPILEIEIDGVVEKIEITDKSLMPDDTGIEVALEIPAGTDPATHQYKITHMLTQDAWDGSNKKAGDIETLTVHRYDEKYLYVMMKNFSPVAIAWKELPAEVIIPDVVIEELPQTGDPSSLLAWVTLLGASGIGLHAMKRRKK